jgi:putative ABC transport system permease protein
MKISMLTSRSQDRVPRLGTLERASTAVYASPKSWAVVIPVEAWLGGIASAVLIGALAGLLPAVRASRMPPTVALRTV